MRAATPKFMSYRGMTAPGQGGDPSRFAIMIEANPWTPQEAMEKALLYRGSIVAAWGNIETWLSELAVRASHADAYRGLKESFPYKIESRIGFLEQVLRLPGPLQPYASLGLLILVRVRNSAELRNRMAHARMRVLPNWGVTFEELVGQKDRVIVRQHRYSPQQMEEFARRATRLSRFVQRAAGELDRKKLLPPLSGLSGPVGEI